MAKITRRPFLHICAVLLCCVPLLCCVLLLRAGAANAAPDCAAVYKDGEKVLQTATASAFANLRKAEGSLRYESEQMLNAASAKLDQSKGPEGFCPAGCVVAAKPKIVFRSEPKKYLIDYSDSKKCAELFSKSEKHPFSYPDRSFATQDEFNSWFGDFSQGKGKDGTELYKQCDGACSPRYTCYITKVDGKLHVDAEAVCGAARDKDDNNYELSYNYRYYCEDAK